MTTADSVPIKRVPLTAQPFVREGLELALVALAFLLYFIVRANVVDRVDQAVAHAREIVSIERDLGIFQEGAIQDRLLGSTAPIRFLNFVYFWLDFPLIAVIGLVMYRCRRDVYSFTRDTILLAGGVALIAYNFYPVAPPRLLAESGLVDTLQRYNNLSYQAQSTQFFVNPYAAMPSLHVGWAVLLAIGVIRAFPRQRWVLPLALTHPIAQWTSTIVTGNHYILDGVGGLIAAGLGIALAVGMQRWGYPACRRLTGALSKAA